MVFAIFDYINAKANMGNNELALDHFMYYFYATRLLGNNWLHHSLAKKPAKKKLRKGKEVAKQPEAVDLDHYKH